MQCGLISSGQIPFAVKQPLPSVLSLFHNLTCKVEKKNIYTYFCQNFATPSAHMQSIAHVLSVGDNM